MVCVLEQGWNKTLQGCGPPGTEFDTTGLLGHTECTLLKGKLGNKLIKIFILLYFTLIFSKLCLKKLACLLLQCSDGIWKRCMWTTKRTPLLLFFQLTNIQSTARLVFCVKDRVTGVESASKRAQRMHDLFDLDRISKDLWKRTFRLNRKRLIDSGLSGQTRTGPPNELGFLGTHDIWQYYWLLLTGWILLDKDWTELDDDIVFSRVALQIN